MKKVVVNSCYGGYGWSKEALDEYERRTGVHVEYGGRIDREDPVAIQMLEELGSKFCSGRFADLTIETYDDSIFRYEIDEYDGIESLTLFPALTEDRVRSCRSMDEVVNLLSQCGVLVPAAEKECAV